MKNARFVRSAWIPVLAFLFSACGAPAPETVVVVVTATDLPTEEPIVEPTPTLVPLALSGPQSGEKMKWLDGSTLLYVPGGEFTMGDGVHAFAHNVMLDGFWIQQTKVTNRMYEQCVKTGSCTAPKQELGGPVFGNPLFANHPVVGVTWDQAQAYCAWVQGGLPTEAQWEKTARGTGGNTYPWGSARPSCDLLNYATCVGRTTDVHLYPAGASPYGALDMAGNVFEWVSDWYGEGYYQISPFANPTGPESGQYRVVRGSSFESSPDQLPSTIRRFNEPTDSGRDLGFRCVVPNPQPVPPYCQLSAFVPSGAIATQECQLPEGFVTDQYCSGGDGYGVVQISFGATWQVRGTRMQCTETVAGGIRKLICRGPRGIESTNEVLVCNPSCTAGPDVTGVSPACDSGYTLDPASGKCNYTPILREAGVGGCPPGYTMIDRGGQKVCMVAPDAGGLCPAGTYFDELAGVCVPPNGQTDAPYGIDEPLLARQTYAGCAPGYTYHDGFQCCQATSASMYPGCAPGYAFRSDVGACTPAEVEQGDEGCVVVRVTTLRCAKPVDVCAQYTYETPCVFNPACRWDEKDQRCEMKSQP